MFVIKDHFPYSYETPAYEDSDSLSSSSQYQEYQDFPSPSSDMEDRKSSEISLAPFSGINLKIVSEHNAVVQMLRRNNHASTSCFSGREEEGAVVPVPV